MSRIRNIIRRYLDAKEKIEEEDRLDMMMASEPEPMEEEQKKFWASLGYHRKILRRHRLLMVGLVCLFLMGGLLFLYLHVGTEYTVLKEEDRSDISGTAYAEFGDYVLKYSSDGISCMTGSGTVKWSSTFSMQSPLVDICGTTMVIADQQGTEVYIFDEGGLLGQFQTSLPIEKVRVARQGVVAAVLNDGDVTWINYYDTGGTQIATTKTSLSESGYPLDIDLSPDGLKIAVSYLRVTQGIMNTRVCFYNFDSVGQSAADNLVASETYESTVAPEILFFDEATSAVIMDDGFCIFSGKQIPEQTMQIEFDEEILSFFHDGEQFGFIFESDKDDYKYCVKLYNSSGKQIMKTYFDFEYKDVKLCGDSLILFNDQALEVYNTGGRKKFSGDYDKAIEDVIKIKGFRKYIVISQDYITTIRLK